MGGNASVIVPSRYDDVKNGIDSIVEFDDNIAVSHLALAIDVTESEIGVSSKLDRIRRSIEEDQLSRAKYFRSKNFRGELTRVPRVVVGAEREKIKELTDLMLRFKRMQNSITESRKLKDESESVRALSRIFVGLRRELADHPLQKIILLEIKGQLEAFRDYAHDKGRNNAASDYARLLNLIESVIEEKSDMMGAKNDVSEDRILKMILEEAKSLGGQK